VCPACESIEWEGQPCQICQPTPAQPAPVQEPVAWLVEFENGEQELHFDEQSVGETNTPLYTVTPAPAAQRQWVGLTKDEFRDFASTLDYGTGGLIRAIEAKLKEKNT
jgi:hypothetical protein